MGINVADAEEWLWKSKVLRQTGGKVVFVGAKPERAP